MKQVLLSLAAFLFAPQLHIAQCNPTLATNLITGCAPLSVVLNCPNINSGTAVWNSGVSTATGLSTTMLFPTPASYIVTLSIVSGTCQGTATIAINVVTGPANGCSNTVQYLNELSNSNNVSLFPNPAKDYLSLALAGTYASETLDYSIVNQLGQTVLSENYAGSPIRIPVADLSPGIYVVNLRTSQGTLSKKFVKTL